MTTLKDRGFPIKMDREELVIEKVQPLCGGLSGGYIKHSHKVKQYAYADVLAELGVRRV
jgi:hypothetical protein